jgi:hypothetical protein
MEIWKDINGYIGYYQISNYGRVKSLARPHGYGIISEKIKQTHTSKRGYKRVPLSINAKSKTWFIHTLVANAFLIKTDPKHEVNHMDADKLNNRVDNLEWVSHARNVRHAADNNLLHSGRNGKHKRAKKVQHKITGEIFSSIADAAKAYDIHVSNLATELRTNNPRTKFQYL